MPEGTEFLENQEQLPPDEEGHYEVESITGSQTHCVRERNIIEMQVLWKGYPSSESTCEPRTELMQTAPEIVCKYQSSNSLNTICILTLFFKL